MANSKSMIHICFIPSSIKSPATILPPLDCKSQCDCQWSIACITHMNEMNTLRLTVKYSQCDYQWSIACIQLLSTGDGPFQAPSQYTYIYIYIYIPFKLGMANSKPHHNIHIYIYSTINWGWPIPNP